MMWRCYNGKDPKFVFKVAQLSNQYKPFKVVFRKALGGKPLFRERNRKQTNFSEKTIEQTLIENNNCKKKLSVNIDIKESKQNFSESFGVPIYRFEKF